MRHNCTYRRGFLICFIGIDGSGKTTLANAMLTTLRGRGIECEYVWGRFGSVLVDRIVAITKRFVFRSGGGHSTSRKFLEAKSRIFRNRFIAFLYTLFVLVDYFGQILFKLWLPHIRGRNIICDRSVYDTIIDLGADLDYSTAVCLKLLTVYLRLAPQPDLVFFISVPEQVAYERKDDISSLEYLRRRKDLYTQVAKRYDMVLLDGSLGLEEVQSLAENRLLKHVGEMS